MGMYSPILTKGLGTLSLSSSSDEELVRSGTRGGSATPVVLEACVRRVAGLRPLRPRSRSRPLEFECDDELEREGEDEGEDGR